MANGVYIKLLDSKELVAKLTNLVKQAKGPALRKALRKQGTFMLKVVKANIGANVHGRTGALKRSMGQKVKAQPSKSRAFCAIFARKGFTVPDAYVKGVIHNPVNIAHLVEYGHGGPRKAGEHPFMRPALDTQGQQSAMLFGDELAKALLVQK